MNQEALMTLKSELMQTTLYPPAIIESSLRRLYDLDLTQVGAEIVQMCSDQDKAQGNGYYILTAVLAVLEKDKMEGKELDNEEIEKLLSVKGIVRTGDPLPTNRKERRLLLKANGGVL